MKKSTKKLISALVALTVSAGYSLEASANGWLLPLLMRETKLANRESSDGSGQVIAVLDCGFDLMHDSFILDGEGKLKPGEVDSLKLNAVLPEGVSSFRVSEKIPFAYDYVGMDTGVGGSSMRGTMLISAAAGAKVGVHEGGVAPGAQILAMKVCHDTALKADPDAVVAAIDDAITLGADVILAAFPENGASSDPDGKIESAFARARAEGISVVAPAGEARALGSDRPYYTEAGIITPTVDRIDTGTISYPGSSPYAFTSGSAVTNLLVCDSIKLADGTVIPYSDSNEMYETPSENQSFAAFFEKKTLEYVVIGGLGAESDYPEGIDLSGKLALVNRGELTFVEKCEIAHSHGAIGIIVIDTEENRESTLKLLMDLTDAPIPAIMVPLDSAESLINADVKAFTVVDEKVSVKLADTPVLSEYSAHGVTSELLLKPDVTVVGESVECAISGNSYVYTSGTLIASARLAGMLACTRGRLVTPRCNKLELEKRARLLLASSAEIMTSGGMPYSPREQGSGCANEILAAKSELLITASGEANHSHGEYSGRSFTFEIELENLTNTDKTCILDAIVGLERFETYTYETLDSNGELAELYGKEPTDEISFMRGYNVNGDINVKVGAIELNTLSEGKLEMTLAPEEKRVVSVTVTLDEELYERYSNAYVNGFFVEGFVRASTEETTASLPFIGFNGDWSDADALDRDVFTGIEPELDYTLLWRSYSGELGSGRLMLGLDPYTSLGAASGYKPEHVLDEFDKDEIVLSPIADHENAAAMLTLALKRNVHDVIVRVRDSHGEVISERKVGDLFKTYADYLTNMTISPEIELWNGRADDNHGYIYPDGSYTLELSYLKPDSDERLSIEYPLILDSEAPEIEVVSLDEESGILTISVSDERISYVNVTDGILVDAVELEDGSFDVNLLEGPYIYIEAVDRAMNSSVVRIANPFVQP